jgi:hypothetical protein
MPPDGYSRTAEAIRLDRQIAFYSRAFVDNEDVMAILHKGMPHSARDRAKLAKAAESLNAYLAELER